MTTKPSISVDVWLWDNADLVGKSAELCACLSDDERARQVRKKQAQAGLHWAISRARVRKILSRYVDVDSADIAFLTNPFGQLSIANSARRDIFFSVSHDGSLSALAICPSAPVGIDIERVQDVSLDEMNWPLSPIERRDLAEVQPHDLSTAFFRYWTLKEAFIKAIGMGVSFPLHSFSMTPFKSKPGLLQVSGDPKAPNNWTFEAHEILPSLRYALAVKADGAMLNCAYH